EIRARHILIKLPADANEQQRAEARKKAEDVLAKVQKGGDFAKLAQQFSEDAGSASKGGDLGLFSRGRVVPAFDAAAFALEPGGGGGGWGGAGRAVLASTSSRGMRSSAGVRSGSRSCARRSCRRSRTSRGSSWHASRPSPTAATWCAENAWRRSRGAASRKRRP